MNRTRRQNGPKLYCGSARTEMGIAGALAHSVALVIAPPVTVRPSRIGFCYVRRGLVLTLTAAAVRSTRHMRCHLFVVHDICGVICSMRPLSSLLLLAPRSSLLSLLALDPPLLPPALSLCVTASSVQESLLHSECGSAEPSLRLANHDTVDELDSDLVCVECFLLFKAPQ